MNKFLLSAIIFLLSFYIHAATITSVSSGNWSDGATWDSGSAPTSGDDVVIAAGHTVTLNADATILSLTIDSGGSLIVGNDATARNLTVSGSTTINGSFTVAAYDITHSVIFQGDVTNNGTLDLYTASSQTADAIFDGTFTIGGSNSPQFAKVTFNSGTVTAGVAFDINGAVVIEDGAIFADGNYTHSVAGNWTLNGTGQITGNGTIQMDAPLIQSITTPAAFYNLSVNGGGICVLGAAVTVTNDFIVTNNSEINTSQSHIFQGNFTVDNGSKYTATAGRATFNATSAQTLSIGTTNGISNVVFYQLYFDNGGSANPKNVSGDIVAKSLTYIYNDAEVNDNGNNHELHGLRLDGTCNFSGTVTATGGTFYDDGGDGDFTLGTADLICQYLYVGSNDIMRVNGNVTVGLEDNTDYNYLVINDGSQLIGQAGNALLVRGYKSLYVRGANNFPSGFGTITLADNSYVRYDTDIAQTINSSVTYWHLYLNRNTKTADGNLDINGNLYLYNSVDFQMGAYDHTIAGYIISNNDANGNGSLTSTGSVTLDAADASQYIYDNGTGTYTFNDLILTNTAPTTARGKYFRHDIIVNGNFTATNTGGDATKRLYVDIDDHTITGGNDFNLGAHVWLLTSGTNTFQNSMTSFSGAKTFDVNSTVRFDRTNNGSNQNIPGGFTYGNIELYGSNNKIPQAGLDINGNISAVGYIPVLTDNSNQINVAGDWNMSLTTTNLTGNSYIVFDGTTQDISQSHFSNVYFSGSGTKTISGRLDILKNLVIQTGVTVETDQYINIEGNWTEQGTAQFHQTGGVTTFDGTTADQTIAAGANSYFYNFYIDKSGTNKLVTINSDIDINGTFNFVEDNASFDMNGYNMYVARDFYFRNGCSYTHNNGKVFFDGNAGAQLIRNYNSDTIVFNDVEFLGAAVKRLYNNAFRFQGDVTINNTTLDGQYWDHYVEGNWINTGIFRHSRTIYFDGSSDQTISQSSFHSIRLQKPNTKTLTGDINLTGNLWIDDATLDVSASNYNITLDDYWHNDSTGSFIAHQGTVTVTGENNRIFTGKTNTAYNSGQVVTQGGTKDFYNLTINATNADYWMFIHGNLTVKNNFEIVQGRFYQSYDPNTYGINDIEVGGDFINHGSIYNNNYGEKITLNPTTGAHIFDPGSSNTYSILNFEGAAGTSYTFNSDLTLYNNRAITITNGDIYLNAHKITTNAAGGDINLNGGSLEVDSAAMISMGNAATFTNAGGIFKLIGDPNNPASLIATSGNFTFLQSSGTIHANNYRIEGTAGNGIEISGGSIDATNTFQNGSFSGGTGNAYLTTTGIDLGGNRTISDLTFNSGPTYNVQRTSGNGAMNFENAIGTLAGEPYDNDDADPGSLINWTYPGAAYWDGNTDGDGDNVHWNDPQNWSNDAVPTSASMVILDHSAIAGAYTIQLSTTADGNAKNIMINSDGTQIELVLDGQKLTIAGDITIGSGSVLTQTNATDTIFVGGSWSNQGTFNEGTSTVVFNPTTGTHTITTQGATDSFYNIVFNGTGGTNVISSTLDINGNFELKGGTLNAGTNTITIAGDWIRTGGAVFNYGTSTVNFDNAGNQNINGGEFYNFITSNSGTKTASANIDINNDITIGSGTVFDGGANIIYVGDDWTNEVGNTGFTQTGAGTVIFDGTVSDQNICSSATQPTTFNHLTLTGTRTKYTRQNITINGNLIINSAALYIIDGTTVDGAGASNTLSMGGGRIYVNGANNFPQNFETISLSAGTVDYYANIDQSIYPTSYYNLMVRRINSGNATTKTLAGDITVNGNLYIYDDETLLDVDNHIVNLWGGLYLATGGRQINWGANGTLNHFGEYFTVDADITSFNNVIKKNRGYFRVRYHSIDITGDMSILEDAYLQQDTVNITCTGTNKTFTLAATAYVYSSNPETLGSSNGRKAFPVGFANYNLHKDSRVYINGTIGDQVINTAAVYGNLYISTNAQINIGIDGDLDVNGDFRMYRDAPSLIDNGHNINIAGSNIDIRTYTPSNTTTMTFDGADQRIFDAGQGATVFDMKNVVFAGSGQKSLYYNGNDWYNITGDLTINSGVTVYLPRRLDFSGANWTNNGTFNHTAYVVNFTSGSDQNIDPGQNNDFYAVSFSGAGTKTFVNNGINVNNGSFTIENGTSVNMNNLTHYIASERITNNGGTWTTDNASFVWDRNGTQYIPAMSAQDFIFRRYDQWNRVRYLEGAIDIDDLTIEEGTQLRCSANGETSTPSYNVTMTGNFTNNGYLYAYGNTFVFESNNGNAKTIKQGQGSFDNVTFNQAIWGQNTRTYTLTEETRFYEDLTIGSGATLDLNGQILRLGNDDPNDPVEPQAEQHSIESGATLNVDAGASLIFSCRDVGNPVLDVNGTLKIVGTNGNNATLTSTDWYTNSHRIDININNGGTIYAQYYLIKYLVDEGLYVDAGATIDPTDNFSNGTWSDINTSTSGSHYYLECNADVSGIGTVDNLTFNFNGTPTVGTHFNVKRAAGATGVLTFGGTVSGLLAGQTYEADDTGENNSGTSLIEWPAPSEVYWTGNVSTDWFDANNWSPTNVPTNLTNAIIPLRSNNPIITGQDAVCKDLQITDGFLKLQSAWNLTVSGDVYVGTGTSVGILAIEDPACTITVSGNWTRAQNALFVHGNGTVVFNAAGGSISIDPRSSAFGNITFNGGASFMLNRYEIFVDNNFTISSGTVQPIVNNYLLHIKGNYNNVAGTFDKTTYGTILFDGTNDQTISNANLWAVTIDGSGNKTTSGTCTIDGQLNIKNGVLVGGNVIDMNNYVTIEATGGFNDGGFTHTFSGYRWTGTGSYTGTGTIEFDRAGYQLIKGATFNNLTLKNNGGVTLEDNVNMTGNLSLIAPNNYLNVQTYQITNTSGNGTFSMADSRRTYIRGANNFPIGFSSYSFHKNSYTYYDGTMAQTIAAIPVVYGRLYLDNSIKTTGGNLDINGILYLYDDASLDVTANNYRINIEGDWYNTAGATFIPREGEVIFDGNDDNTYLRIYDESKDTNPFYNLTVNKGSGYLRSYWTDITVQNNLRVLNGTLYQNQIMYVGGDMSALSGTFAAAGTYYLNKTDGSSNLQLNGSVLNNLTINSGAIYYLQDDLQMNGNFNLIAGTFDGNGNLVRMGNYGEVHEISGIYKIGAGGILQLADYSTFKVKSGGEIYVVGDIDNVASVTNYTGRYYFNIENGGTIRAMNYMFEYMAESGIYIKDGGIINNNYNFSYGTFTNPAAGGTCLRIENNQDFTDASGNAILEVSFPQNTGGGVSNVTKTIAAGGVLDFKDYSGELAGEDFDNDPDNLINWISPPYVMWTGNIDNDWYKIGNWQVNSGADRIPLISDNVIITQQTNQPIINTDGAVAKTLEIQENAILTLNSSAATDTTLIVANDVLINGTINMTSGNDTLAVGGNWTNNGVFSAGQGTVIFNANFGVKSLDNLNDYFYNLHINTVADIQLSRNLTVNNNFIIKNGNFDLAANNRILTVIGNFYNNDVFTSQNGKLILAGTGTNQIFDPGSSTYYNIEISANSGTTVRLTNNNLDIIHNMNINSGTFDLNSQTFNMGDGVGTDVLTIAGGSLNVDANAYLKPGNNATIEVNSGGTIVLLGMNIDNPAYVQSQSGTYGFNVNSGGTIHAKYYNIQNTNASGVRIKSGASIDATNNFSDGIWRNGSSPGQYLFLENDFADYTVTGVYFHNGASVNVKRDAATTSGVITFEDAIGLLAGYQYEDDDNSATTGAVRWTYTHPQNIWIGSVSSDWNDANNWGLGTVPTNNDAAIIPDIDEASNYNPIIGVNSGSADAVCYDLRIENGGLLTLGNNKNLDVDNTVTINAGGNMTVTSGSVSQINVADIWSVDGSFNHGGSATVVFDAPAGKLLTISGNTSFYNFEINSAGSAEYMTGTRINIDGNFTITSGVFSISDPADTLYIGGNYSNSGTFNHGNGIVVLNGNNQNISSTGSGNFYKLSCEGSQIKSLTSDITVENDIEIKSGSTLDCSNRTLSLWGDWINRGTFTPSTGTVKFNGTSTQLIDNYNTETFYNFIVDNSSSSFPQILLYEDLYLSGTNWTMTDGVIETSINQMLIVGSNITLTGGNTVASYVSGPITKEGSSDFIFPIGDGAKFARLGISGLSASGTFVAQYFESPYSDLASVGAGIDHVSGYEHWTLNRTSGTGEPIVSFYWEDGTQSGIDNLTTLTTALYTGGQWEDKGNGGTTGTINSGSISSGTAFTTFGPCGFASTNEDNPLNSYTRWTGDISTAWNNPNNWSMGVPTVNSDALISSTPANQPIIDIDAVVRKLTIGQNASLEINPLKSLTTEGKFYIYGTLRLKSDANGNASLINKNTITYGANCNVVTELYLTGWQYHHVSSPTETTHSDRFKVDPVAPNYNHNFYTYDETDLNSDWTATAWHEYNGNMAVMEGYTTYFDRNPTILFDRATCGDFNTGNRSKTLTYTGASAAPVINRGWNFVGNPYPAYLDWDAAGWTKTNIYNSIYFWNGNNYSYYVSSGTAQDDGVGTNDGTNIIPPMQGYFVKVIEGSDDSQNQTGTLVTPESARTTSTHAFWKKKRTKSSSDLIRITIDNGQKDETLIRFVNTATAEFDRQYDAFKLFPGDGYGVPMIYSVLSNNINVAINTLASYDYGTIIPLGIRIPTAGNIHIGIPALSLSKGIRIYLEDTYLKETYDVTDGYDLYFDSEAGQFDDRFVLKFEESVTSIDEEILQPEISIYANNNYLYLSSDVADAIVGNVNIYNASGRLIYNTYNKLTYKAKIDVSVLSDGVYIVKLINDYGTITDKFVVVK